MKNQAMIDALQERISVAARDCEAWRAAGLNDNYMEAYDLVEALQLQLRQQLRSPLVNGPDAITETSSAGVAALP